MPSPSEGLPAGRSYFWFGTFFLAGVAALASIALANIFFGLALIFFLAARIRPRWDLQAALLLLYALLSMVSVLFASDPIRSAPNLREAILYLVFPMAAACFPASGDRRFFPVIFLAVSLIFSVWGLVEYVLKALPDPAYRIHGPASHYMAYCGLLLFLTAVLLAYASRGPDPGMRKACLAAGILNFIPIFLSLTRNAWLGLFAMLAVLALARRKWTYPAAATVLIALLLALPGPVGQRFRSIFDPADATNRDRLAMWKAGARMVEEKPFTGLGLGMPREDYARFRRPGAVRFYTPHLHSNLVQIAAERGLPALGAYLGFVGATIAIGWRKRDHWRGLATLLAASSIFVAGFFEFNFGSTVMLWATLTASALHYRQDEEL